MEAPLFADRKYLKRHDNKKNRSWQFQFELDPIKESKNFADSKHGSKEGAFIAAKAYRDDFLKTAAELGLIVSKRRSNKNDLPICLNLSPRNTSGIVGIYRESNARKGMRIPEMNWIANYKDEDGHQKQKGFSIKSLGEKSALIAAITFRRDFVSRTASKMEVRAKRELVEKHAEDLDFLIEYISSLVGENELYLLLGTLNSPSIPSTEKQEMLARRIGQERFRRLVLAVWKGQCAITGATQFLIAGHIKPWSESSDAERLDPFNGLALSPVYDRAFDSGLITFEDDGRIRVSPLLQHNATRLGITCTEKISGLSSDHLVYLQYHQKARFRTQ